MPGLYEERSSSGKSELERGSPGITLSPAPQDSDGGEKGAKAGVIRSSRHDSATLLMSASSVFIPLRDSGNGKQTWYLP